MEFDFDDSVFVSKTRSTTGDKLTSYNAKVCSPLWFEDVSGFTQLQFSADYHYGMCHYLKAMEKYTQLLEMLPEAGRSKRRDLLESLARCHLKLNNPEKALLYTNLLSEHASNDDHQVQTLSVFHEIYQKQHNFADDVLVLQKLIGYHPHHYIYWLHLAQAYRQIEDNTDTVFNKPQHCGKVFSSYLRARLLLQFSLKFSGVIVKPKLQEMFKQINDQIDTLDVSVEHRLQAEKHLCKDLPNDFNYATKSLDDGTNDPAKNVVHIQNKLSFEQRWFSWRQFDEQPS